MLAVMKVSTLIRAVLGCLVAMSCYAVWPRQAMASEAEVLAIQDPEAPRSSWGLLLDKLGERRVAVDLRDVDGLPRDMRGIKLILANGPLAQVAPRELDIAPFLQVGGKFMLWGQGVARARGMPISPYRLRITPAASPYLHITDLASPLLDGLGNRTLGALSGPAVSAVAAGFDAQHWRVWGYTVEGPAFLGCHHGAGEMAVALFGSGLINHPQTMEILADNIMRWANLSAQPMPRLSLAALRDRVAETAILRSDPEGLTWGWTGGTLAYALLELHQHTRDRRSLGFVKAYLDFHMARGIGVSHVNNCCPSAGALRMYEITRDRRYLNASGGAFNHVFSKGARAPDGCLLHRGSLVYVDTLFMVCPFLSRAYSVWGNELYMDEAARQILLHARRLQDPKTGLFYHGWDEAAGAHTPCFWARGNGWALAAIVETLDRMPDSHRDRAALLDVLRRQASGTEKHQDPTGLWRTVLDRSDSYLETSGSALIVFGLAKAMRRGWLDSRFAEVVARGITGLRAKVTFDGRVVGTSDGTRPGDFQHYQSIKVGCFPYGTGAFLLAMNEGLGFISPENPP